ncbi:hypothetical protein FXB39_10160 [Nocardioides sp. BGMRC 2183]|nr:hypothetical protein FXB39_10160 [Nocardioides sp. BGMRC 2183]
MSATAGDPASEWVPTPEAQRMRDVFEMHEFGVALYRQRMRREHPDADESEVAALTRAWLWEDAR